MWPVTAWIQWAIRLCVVVLLTIPLAIAFQVAGMLLTGWGAQGFGWLAVGILWLPTVLAWCVCFAECRNIKHALRQGTALGLIASLVLLLSGFALIRAAGSMDGGI